MKLTMDIFRVTQWRQHTELTSKHVDGHEVASLSAELTSVAVFCQRHRRFIGGCIDSLSIEVKSPTEFCRIEAHFVSWGSSMPRREVLRWSSLQTQPRLTWFSRAGWSAETAGVFRRWRHSERMSDNWQRPAVKSDIMTGFRIRRATTEVQIYSSYTRRSHPSRPRNRRPRSWGHYMNLGSTHALRPVECRVIAHRFTLGTRVTDCVTRPTSWRTAACADCAGLRRYDGLWIHLYQLLPLQMFDRRSRALTLPSSKLRTEPPTCQWHGWWTNQLRSWHASFGWHTCKEMCTISLRTNVKM